MGQPLLNNVFDRFDTVKLHWFVYMLIFSFVLFIILFICATRIGEIKIYVYSNILKRVQLSVVASTPSNYLSIG